MLLVTLGNVTQKTTSALKLAFGYNQCLQTSIAILDSCSLLQGLKDGNMMFPSLLVVCKGEELALHSSMHTLYRSIECVIHVISIVKVFNK